MLNFDCYDESELEQEMSFEEMLKTDPKKFLGPNRPKSSFRGKKISELPKYAQQQRRLSINTSRDTLVNSSLDIKVHDDDYKPDFGNVFKGFDINYFQEDEK
ncbi:hypothetical protein K502DRAFT_331889 [Neoconidiobolus thromboides FSU 785]|nr:hypothetical protein K502DRAFT_331889 [Neoconidiobolus thromboides FSU 785]